MCTNIDLYTHIKIYIDIQIIYTPHKYACLPLPFLHRSGRDAPPGHWRRGVAGGGAESPQGHQRRGTARQMEISMTSRRVWGVDG